VSPAADQACCGGQRGEGTIGTFSAVHFLEAISDERRTFLAVIFGPAAKVRTRTSRSGKTAGPRPNYTPRGTLPLPSMLLDGRVLQA